MNNKLKSILYLAKTVHDEQGSLEMFKWLNTLKEEIYWRFVVPRGVFEPEKFEISKHSNKKTGNTDVGIRYIFYDNVDRTITAIEIYERK